MVLMIFGILEAGKFVVDEPWPRGDEMMILLTAFV